MLKSDSFLLIEYLIKDLFLILYKNFILIINIIFLNYCEDKFFS